MLLKIIKGTHYLDLKLAQRQLYLVVSPADLAAINCEAVTGKICKTWPSPLCRANVEFYRFYLINHHTHPNKLHIFVNPTLHAIVYSLWAGVIVLTQVLDGVSGEKGVSHGQLEIFSIFHFLSKLWYSLTPLASLNKIAECAGSTDTSTALVGQYCHHQHLSSQIQNQIKNRHNGYFDSHINDAPVRSAQAASALPCFRLQRTSPSWASTSRWCPDFDRAFSMRIGTMIFSWFKPTIWCTHNWIQHPIIIEPFCRNWRFPPTNYGGAAV